jgi:ABC-type Fe3+/spermidine/putrescine transport system ATPase subunit
MVMSDRIAIMRAGRFEQIGTPADEIYARPVSRFVAEFMGEVNLFDIRRTAEGIAAGALEIAPQAAARIGLPEGGHGALMVRPEAVRFLAPARPPRSCCAAGCMPTTFSAPASSTRSTSPTAPPRRSRPCARTATRARPANRSPSAGRSPRPT